MTAEYILDIARHAQTKVMRYGRCWRDEDFEDARQEAIVAILQASGRSDNRGYLYGAAVLAIYYWMRRTIQDRQRWPKVAGNKLDLFPNHSQALAVDQLLAGVGGLKHLLREQQGTITRLTERNIDREIEYLRLLLQGYTYEEIAFRMAVTRKATWMLHDRLVERLERIVAGKKAHKRVIQPPNEVSLENLRKAATDPAMREKRAASLRRTIASPEGQARWSAAAKRQWARRKAGGISGLNVSAHDRALPQNASRHAE